MRAQFVSAFFGLFFFHSLFAIAASQPKRIITLAPSLAELAADILETELDRIVGVSDFTDYPPGLSKKTSVGPYSMFNVEKVASLKPDLVLATEDGNPKERVERLQDLGLNVVTISTQSFEEVKQAMLKVSKALGYPERGESLAKRFEKGLEKFKERSKKRKTEKNKVLLQINDNPLVVAGEKSFLNSCLEILGAVNTYVGTAQPYPRPSIEDAVSKDPDIIVVMAMGKNLDLFKEWQEAWLRFPKLKAVKNRRVHLIQSDALIRPSQRLLEGLAILEKVLYPEARFVEK